jgi:hypothetical protein
LDLRIGVGGHGYDDVGRGLPLSTAAGTAQARTVIYTWHATFHLPMQIVEAGRTTTFTYDDANGLRRN